MRLTRRRAALALGIGVPAALSARPALHLGISFARDGDGLPAVPDGHADDASRMNQTAIAEVVTPEGDAPAVLAALRSVLAKARRDRLPICIAGARHTMGGHTIAPGGLVIDTAKMSSIEVLGTAARVLEVGSGAYWHDLIRVLDARGLAVGVMQSNDGFTLGGSMGANCHGWQPARPPLASTVESFRIVLADGSERECSREQNAELFRLVLGGYGLFGVVTSARLRVVENRLLEAQRFRASLSAFPATWAEHATGAELAFGRLCPDPDRLFEEALLTVYRAVDSKTLPSVARIERAALKRALFRGEVGSDYGKGLRWRAETLLGSEAGQRATRNQLMSEPIGLFQNRNPEMTDVLHEYFVPLPAFLPFVERLRGVLARHPDCDLLNVTVRNVLADGDAFLRYARSEVFSLVLLFCHARTPEADAAMQALTRELVDVALAQGGTHYLPYRLHATREQLRRAYPMADAFFAKKRELDPELIFRNRFYDAYA
jgi:FAD/FMN-containing dehydrogenase